MNPLKWFANLWADEPVIITGLTTAVLDFEVAYGIRIDEMQRTAILGLITAIGLLVARSKVSPTS